MSRECALDGERDVFDRERVQAFHRSDPAGELEVEAGEAR